jgi:hypothetical protein
MVLMFSPNTLSSAKTSSRCFQFSCNPILNFLDPFWQHILNQGWKVIALNHPTCFRPFWIRSASDRFLPARNLQQLSLKHIWISLTNLIGISNSTRVLYNTFLLKESYAFSKSINNSCTVPLYSNFFSSYLANTEYLIHGWWRKLKPI